jgi:hypothetical protein
MGDVRSRLLICGVIGPVVFIASLLVQGAVRADYDPLRHPVSSLSLGAAGWVSAAVFFACFVLSSLGFNQVMMAPVGGLWQRLALVGLGWLAALALHLRGAMPRRSGEVR